MKPVPPRTRISSLGARRVAWVGVATAGLTPAMRAPPATAVVFRKSRLVVMGEGFTSRKGAPGSTPESGDRRHAIGGYRAAPVAGDEPIGDRGHHELISIPLYTASQPPSLAPPKHRARPGCFPPSEALPRQIAEK